MTTIALVDDDRNILSSLSMALEQEGFQVRTYSDGVSALSALQSTPPSLAILDIKMPRMDGHEVLKRLRQSSDLPVIFLTSKDDEVDEMVGLSLGADDYIKKPFSQRLLLQRVRAVLRRAEARNAPAGTAAPKEVMVRGKLLLDQQRHSCTWDGKEVQLTVTEFLILFALSQRPGIVKSDNSGSVDDQVYVMTTSQHINAAAELKHLTMLDRSPELTALIQYVRLAKGAQTNKR